MAKLNGGGGGGGGGNISGYGADMQIAVFSATHQIIGDPNFFYDPSSGSINIYRQDDTFNTKVIIGRSRAGGADLQAGDLGGIIRFQGPIASVMTSLARIDGGWGGTAGFLNLNVLNTVGGLDTAIDIDGQWQTVSFNDYGQWIVKHSDNGDAPLIQFYKDRSFGASPQIQTGDMLGVVSFNTFLSGGYVGWISTIASTYRGDGTTPLTSMDFAVGDMNGTNQLAMSIDGTGQTINYNYDHWLQNNDADGKVRVIQFYKTRSGGDVQPGDSLGQLIWNAQVNGGFASLLGRITGSYTGDGTTLIGSIDFSVNNGETALTIVGNYKALSSGDGWNIILNQNSDDSIANNLAFYKDRGDGAYPYIQNNDELGEIQWRGNINGSYNDQLGKIIGRYIGDGTTTNSQFEVWTNQGSGLVSMLTINDSTIFNKHHIQFSDYIGYPTISAIGNLYSNYGTPLTIKAGDANGGTDMGGGTLELSAGASRGFSPSPSVRINVPHYAPSGTAINYASPIAMFDYIGETLVMNDNTINARLTMYRGHVGPYGSEPISAGDYVGDILFRGYVTGSGGYGLAQITCQYTGDGTTLFSKLSFLTSNGNGPIPEFEIDGNKIGFYGVTPVVRPAAMTGQDTTITFTAPVTPTYAITDLTTTTPYGFVSSDEAQTVLKVIANLQTRVSELETKLQVLGLLS